MMGSATALPQAPVEKTVFLEDMSEQQLATHVRFYRLNSADYQFNISLSIDR